MRVLFDASTPPRLAAALHGDLAARGGVAVHVRDLPGGAGASDAAWIDAARGARLVVTGDPRLHRVPALRLALRRAGLRGLVLGGAFQALPAGRQAALLVERWPEVEDLAGATAAPFLIELPAARSGALRPLP